MTSTRRSERLTLAGSAVLAGSLLLSGCATAGSGEAGAPEPVSIAIGDPMAPLVPGNTVEEYGTQILSSLWTGMV